jgi:pimeloyl-ACP methyl ester carboxylesterase
MRYSRLIAVACGLAGLIAAGFVPVALMSTASAATGQPLVPGSPSHRTVQAPAVRVGRLMLHRCDRTPVAYCGKLAVPLDYSARTSPDIHVGFRWLPATGSRSRGPRTMLAVEGGPGYATVGTQGAYTAMLGSLRRSTNVLLVNLRGTGDSTLVKCAGLEHFGRSQHQYGPEFNRLVAACGRQLNHTWRYRHGGWVHASDLFNTAYSARDVARVLRALRLGRVDLYGDSYGSWFSQVFASRYPGLLRSVTLDSTYQVLGLDPWYTTTVITARRAFAQACSRWPACASATAGQGAWARIGALAARLARAPVTGSTVSAAGTRTTFTVTAETLVNLVNNAGFDPVVYRDLDAAGRALLRHHDSAPLLRLAALSIGFDDTNYALPEFSDGLFFAVSCTDYVQLFSRTATPDVRVSEYDAALRREPARTFAPFTIGQWTRMDQYTEAYSACLHWPTPRHVVAPIVRRPPLVPRRLPVLILSGTADSLTPWLHGASLVARQMGPSARVVRVANLTHVLLEDADDACPASILQRFLRRPGNLAHLSTSCARQVAPVHAVGTYPVRLRDVTPARAAAGNKAGPSALRAVAVALASAGDEISREPLLSGHHDLGLRGGTARFSGSHVVRIVLHGYRWVADATVDGTVVWNRGTGAVTARLSVRAAGTATVHLTARWRAFARPGQLAIITGSQRSKHPGSKHPGSKHPGSKHPGSKHLAATLPAP